MKSLLKPGIGISNGLFLRKRRGVDPGMGKVVRTMSSKEVGIFIEWGWVWLTNGQDSAVRVIDINGALRTS